MCPYGVLLCMARQHAVVWKRMPLYVQVIFEQRCCTLKHQRCEEGGCKWILNNTSLSTVPGHPPQQACQENHGHSSHSACLGVACEADSQMCLL